MVERNNGLRWAAGIALATAGATALYDRMRRLSNVEGKVASADSVAEFEVGRGTPQALVDRASRHAGYELADTNVRSLVIIMAVSIIIMIAGVVGVFFMFAGFDRHFVAETAGDTAEQRADIVPPLPHLQADPYKEIDATLKEQSRRLTTYGWNNADHTSAHIPIARAMRQVVGKPLDSTATADAVGPVGTPDATSAPEAPMPQGRPANRVEGEGRPGAVAPSYDLSRSGDGK